MRLDKYLKITRILKRRTQAKEFCDEGKIYIDGRLAKASSNVKVGQVITLDLQRRKVVFEVLGVPERNVRKSEANTLYKIIEVKEKELDDEA